MAELHSGLSDYSRAAAAGQPGDLGDAGAIPALLDSIASDSAKMVRDAAALAVTKMRGDRAREVLRAEATSGMTRWCGERSRTV